MFDGKKTSVFWIGLLVLVLASVILFSLLWYVLVLFAPLNIGSYTWKYLTPLVAGSVIFILIGLYMMKSGTEKEEEEKIQLLNKQLFSTESFSHYGFRDSKFLTVSMHRTLFYEER
jgi:putative Mn2+ efflux pump MntP